MKKYNRDAVGVALGGLLFFRFGNWYENRKFKTALQYGRDES